MSEYRETIYRGRDNEIVFALEQGGVVLDARGVTRAQLSFQQDGEEVFMLDSADSPTFFDFQQTEAVRGLKTGVLVLKLGETLEGDVPDGLYDVRLYLFDAVNDDGVFWDTIEFEVRGGDAS